MIVDAEIVTGRSVGETQPRTSASCSPYRALRLEGTGRRRRGNEVRVVLTAFTATAARARGTGTVNGARPGMVVEPRDHDAVRRVTGQFDRLRPGARTDAPEGRHPAAGLPLPLFAPRVLMAIASPFDGSRAVTLQRCEGQVGGIHAQVRAMKVRRLPDDLHRSGSPQRTRGDGTRPEGRARPRRCPRSEARMLIPPAWAACVDHGRTGHTRNWSTKPTGPGGEATPPGPVNQQPRSEDVSRSSTVFPAKLENPGSVPPRHHASVQHPQPAACGERTPDAECRSAVRIARIGVSPSREALRDKASQVSGPVACARWPGGADAASKLAAGRTSDSEPAFRRLANRSGGGR